MTNEVNLLLFIAAVDSHGQKTAESSNEAQLCWPLSEARQLKRVGSEPLQLTSSRMMNPPPEPNMLFRGAANDLAPAARRKQ